MGFARLSGRHYRRSVPTYFAYRWEHDSPDDPVLLFEELDVDRMEMRKVHQFRDGTLERTDRVRDGARTTLSWVPVPPEQEIADQREFTVLPLSADEFEHVWQAATDCA